MVYLGGQWIYSWLQANGTVNYETRTSRLDADGSFVAKRAVCANVKSNGLMGLQHVNRVQMLAKRYTDHDFTMSIAYDYAAAYTNPRTWSAAELAAFAIPSQQLEHTMGDDAECQAVRVQLQDVTPSSGSLGIGTGATWIALCFEVVPKTGAYLLPDASR